MYLDIGGETLLRTENILGIFDLDNTTVNKATREYLSDAEKTGFSKTVSYDLPKSFLVTVKNYDRFVYISPLSTATILKRLNG
ncbi:MAG: extracellular matrix regulator RemB [Candidatus Fimenecus sp.]